MKPQTLTAPLRIPARVIRAAMACSVLMAASTAFAAQAADGQKIEIRKESTPAFSAMAEGSVAGKAGRFLVATGKAGSGDTRSLSLWASDSSKAGGSWEETAILSLPWAAAAQWGEKLVIVGGLADGKPSRAVRLIESVDGASPGERSLAELPVALAGAGAAVVGDVLHVFGGVSSLNPASFEKGLWKLNLASPAATWVKGEDFPARPRAFFAATQQYGMLCVFGGVTVPESPEGGYPLLQEAWVYRPKPIEGTDITGWKRAGDLPFPFAAGSALPLGQAGVMLAGGVRPRETAGLPPAPRVGENGSVPWLYHTITDAWCPFDRDLPSAAPLAVSLGTDVRLLDRAASWTLSFPRTVRTLAWIDYVVVVGYFAVLAIIGFCFSRQESSAEFSLGNRKVKWWAAGISMFATGASAISFMAVPALAFATNYVWTFPLLMLVPAFFLTAYFIFPLLRRMEITSTYEYLERRFNHPLRLIASAQCIIIQTIGRTSVVLVLPALAIASVTGMNVFWSVVLMGVLTTIYTSVGGFESVIWTEVFQGILKFIAPLAMVVIAIVSLPEGFTSFMQTGREYSKFEFALPTADVTVPAVWILLISYLLQFTVMKAGDQPIIQRVFSAPLSEVRRVTAMEAACGILIGVITNTLGIAIFCYFRAHPGQFSATAQNDQIVPLFVAQAMPPGFAGVVIAAIFASAMATVASAMNSVATIYTEDFYPHIRPNATDAQRLRTLKITSYAVGLIGTGMALLLAATNPKSLMVVWSQIVSLLGGGVVGVYSLGMFTRRVNGFGAVCGAISSIVITLLVKLHTPLHWSSYLPIAILSCMVTGYLFSLFSPQTKNLDGLTVFTAGDKTKRGS